VYGANAVVYDRRRANNGVMHKSEFNSAVSGATEERSELAGAANVPEGGAGYPGAE